VFIAPGLERRQPQAPLTEETKADIYDVWIVKQIPLGLDLGHR